MPRNRLLVTLLVFISLGGVLILLKMNVFTWMMMATVTLPRDLKMSKDYVETMARVNYWWWNDYKICEIFDEVVEESPDKIAFWLGEEAWSFFMVKDYSMKVANYFHMKGLRRGDVVGQLGVMGSRAVGLWLGLSRLGVATALLPTEVPPDAIVKAASSVFAKAIICDSTLREGLREGNLPEDTEIFVVGSTKDKTVKSLDKELVSVSSKPTWGPKRKEMEETLLYVFPHGSVEPNPVSNYRYAFIATAIHMTLDLKNDDILYQPLPHYETAGSIIGAGQAVIFGNTVVTKKKFSAPEYFPDCQDYGVTVGLYNPSIIRELLQMPSSPADKKHKVRLVVGEGLRSAADWTNFKDRFGIRHIGEYYGYVDSDNTNMVNSYNQAGSVGFFPWFSFPLYQEKLVSYNPETGEPIRDNKGLCIPAAEGKPGILIDELPTDVTINRFSKRKQFIRNVYKDGDAYINTGDILLKDKHGYFYVVDTVADIKRRNENSDSSKTKEDSAPPQTQEKVTDETEAGTSTTKEPALRDQVDESSQPKQSQLSKNNEKQHQEDDLSYQPIDDEASKQKQTAESETRPPDNSELMPGENRQETTEQKEEALKSSRQAGPVVPPQKPPPPQVDLEELFHDAVRFVEINNDRFSNEAKLQVYALYKQATVGNCNIRRPGLLDPNGAAKWDAWNKIKGTDQRVAMQGYVNKVNSLKRSYGISK